MNQPIIHSSVFVAPGAFVTGDVVIGENSSVWYNAVLRGDMAQIIIGKNTNVQDGWHPAHGPRQPAAAGRLCDRGPWGHPSWLHRSGGQPGGDGRNYPGWRRHWQKLPGWGRRAGDAQNSQCQTVPWSWATRQKLSAAFPPKSWKTCATMPMNILRCLKKC